MVHVIENIDVPVIEITKPTEPTTCDKWGSSVPKMSPAAGTSPAESPLRGPPWRSPASRGSRGQSRQCGGAPPGSPSCGSALRSRQARYTDCVPECVQLMCASNCTRCSRVLPNLAQTHQEAHMAGASCCCEDCKLITLVWCGSRPSCDNLTWLRLSAKDLHLAGTHAHQLHRQPHVPSILDVLPEQLLLAVERHPPRVEPLHAEISRLSWAMHMCTRCRPF